MEPKKDGLIAKFMNATDPTQDAKLAAFSATVLAAIVWLSRERHTHGITDQWVNAFYGLCALAGLGGAAMMAVDKIKGKPIEPAAPTPQGTENEKGEGQ